MNHQLTTIAALPGSGAGCASALKPEVAEPRRAPSRGRVNLKIEIAALKPETQALIAKQVAEATRRTLLRIAGAAA